MNIPIFNEEENIVSLYEKLVPVLVGTGRPWEVIFVNDGSTDRSAPLLDGLAEKDDRAAILILAIIR
ncbi:MAG: glycosyltransferase [Candidatus Methylumidiphilus sp.]